MQVDLSVGKPLMSKAYGHIPHLPGSRTGPGDHTCHDGQSRIATVKTRDAKDLVSVTVKLDGTCMAVARINDEIVPLTRSGYLATSSKYTQHQMFADWVHSNESRFSSVLGNGERFVGEWLAQAHGTRYALPHEPFVVFDLMSGGKRSSYDTMLTRAASASLTTPYCLSVGGPVSIDHVINMLSTPHHGELDPVEGAVWRVERNGVFDFICKWVRPEKVDGLYLPDCGGTEEVWNWMPPVRG